MKEERLKLIYEYMEDAGWCFRLIESALIHRELDSNSAWECVKEMERRGDELDFTISAGRAWSESPYKMGLFFWLFNPTNFFDCFGSWLEDRSRK